MKGLHLIYGVGRLAVVFPEWVNNPNVHNGKIVPGFGDAKVCDMHSLAEGRAAYVDKAGVNWGERGV